MKRTNRVSYFGLNVVVALLLFGSDNSLAQDQDWDQQRIKVAESHFGSSPELRSAMESSSSGISPWLLRYRSIDGTFNNLIGINWGKAGGNLRRMVPSEYWDGISEPAGQNRKSARWISNFCCVQNSPMPNERSMSSMVWQWGQFLDHDIVLTHTTEPEQYLPIRVPKGDNYFDPNREGGHEIPFFRSEFRQNRPEDEPREQVNSITSWIDASNVYGSDEATARSLRTLEGGRMKTSAGGLLPLDDEGMFLAGDVRCNEQVCLISMHTLFVREHNRLAENIAYVYPYLSDEQVYQISRKWVAGMIQAITYNEFLPAVLGEDALTPYTGYKPWVFPNISNTFATAGYRFGHSMLAPEIWRMDNFGEKIADGNMKLRDAFFNPDEVKHYGIDCFLKGLTEQHAQEIDTRIVTDVRCFLFGQPGDGGFDLAALNIQRGRDHGLGSLNSVRNRYGLPLYESFEEISDDPATLWSLTRAYDSVDDIDPWIGMLSEKHVPGASVGSTLFYLMKQRFEILRDSDRFWYERDFTGASLEYIRNTRLTNVIYRNSGVRNVYPNSFYIGPHE